MKIFLACAYYSKVDPSTGEVNAEYQSYIEKILADLRGADYEVFNALEFDSFKVNDADPAEAFYLDKNQIDSSDVLVCICEERVSAGLQTEIGYAVAKEKKVILFYEYNAKIPWFNMAMEKSGVLKISKLPISTEKIVENV